MGERFVKTPIAGIIITIIIRTKPTNCITVLVLRQPLLPPDTHGLMISKLMPTSSIAIYIAIINFYIHTIVKPTLWRLESPF